MLRRRPGHSRRGRRRPSNFFFPRFLVGGGVEGRGNGRGARLVSQRGSAYRAVLRHAMVTRPKDANNGSKRTSGTGFPIVGHTRAILLFHSGRSGPYRSRRGSNASNYSRVKVGIFGTSFSRGEDRTNGSNETGHMRRPTPTFFPKVLGENFLFHSRRMNSHTSRRRTRGFR